MSESSDIVRDIVALKDAVQCLSNEIEVARSRHPDEIKAAFSTIEIFLDHAVGTGEEDYIELYPDAERIYLSASYMVSKAPTEKAMKILDRLGPDDRLFLGLDHYDRANTGDGRHLRFFLALVNDDKVIKGLSKKDAAVVREMISLAQNLLADPAQQPDGYDYH